MINKPTEKGQALIIIALAAVVLFGFAALAIDGSAAFSDRRHAQNAADTAAMAAALTYVHKNTDEIAVAQSRATSNGYDNNGTSNVVTVEITPIAKGEGCPGDAVGEYIKVSIVSTIQTSLARVIGQTQVINRVSATARGCGAIFAPLFPGNAVVALNQTNSGCGFDTGNSHASHWHIQGGGVFSNNCAFSSWNGAVTLDAGECVTTVGTASNTYTCSHPNQTSAAVSSAAISAMMPPNPCTPGGIGLPQGSGSTFSNGVYCISNMDALDQKDVVLNNATLYVTDTNFNLKFAGGGGFSGTPSGSGDYANYYMIIAPASTPCPSFTSQNSQVIVFRGNSSGTFSGSILAPTACLDLRGNGETSGIHSQVIGYNVTSNGNAEVYINYNEAENHLNPYNAAITLWK